MAMNTSNEKGSVSRLLETARSGDQPSLNALFNRFYARLIGWANRELHPAKCRAFDAEDIAVEAFHSFYLGMEQGKYPDIGDRRSLQSLLATITIRKAINRIEEANTVKRGGGKIAGESVFNEFDSLPGIDLNPAEQSIIDDEVEYCLNKIPEKLRDVLRLTIHGLSTSDIARELNCSTRSIQLKKMQISTILTEVNPFNPRAS
jgi:RNA polymerase sigma factor (sigma-70 family)